MNYTEILRESLIRDKLNEADFDGRPRYLYDKSLISDSDDEDLLIIDNLMADVEQAKDDIKNENLWDELDKIYNHLADIFNGHRLTEASEI